jgi:hypothetical protein
MAMPTIGHAIVNDQLHHNVAGFRGTEGNILARHAVDLSVSRHALRRFALVGAVVTGDARRTDVLDMIKRGQGQPFRQCQFRHRLLLPEKGDGFIHSR